MLNCYVACYLNESYDRLRSMDLMAHYICKV